MALTLSANAIVHRVLPDESHIIANLVAAGGVVGLAMSAGATREDLGLRTEDLGAGARAGALASAAVLSVVGGAAALRRTRAFFADARVSDVSRGRTSYELAVRIPIGTALAEELLFRSGMVALFAQRRSWTTAAVASSLLFGLWHVLPTVASLETNPAIESVVTSRAHGAGAVAGVVAATGGAGLAFSLLLRGARSVVAPVMVHAVLNASTYALGRVLFSRTKNG
jgi:uncharacterized protein